MGADVDLFLQQCVNGLVLGGAYVLVALGLYLIFSAMHIPNFAHGEMFALGAFLQYMFVVTIGLPFFVGRSEEHTSELQSLMRISYAVFCLKKQNSTKQQHTE